MPARETMPSCCPCKRCPGDWRFLSSCSTSRCHTSSSTLTSEGPEQLPNGSLAVDDLDHQVWQGQETLAPTGALTFASWQPRELSCLPCQRREPHSLPIPRNRR